MAKPKRFKAKYSAQKVRDGVECKFCGAGIGERCWGKNGVQAKGCHWSRHIDYERTQGDRPKLRRAKGMKVSFVCPICEGPHPKDQHGSLVSVREK